MKFRHEKIDISDADERRLEEGVRAMAARTGGVSAPHPPDAYWQNLIARTNQRIDHDTSGKSLSISWALRVAIPGVVAILSFVIGLHYYVPEKASPDQSVNALVMSLSAQSIDSLIVNPPPEVEPMTVIGSSDDLFIFSEEQIADYLIYRGAVQTFVEGMSDKQLGDVELALASLRD